jgi:anti-anti-sigma regulatory factor
MTLSNTAAQDATTDSKEDNIFSLYPVMNIETADALAVEIKQISLTEKSSFTLDASRVETLTTPGIQIIVSLEKALAAQGGTLRIIGRKDHFNQSFRDAGLERLLA